MTRRTAGIVTAALSIALTCSAGAGERMKTYRFEKDKFSVALPEAYVAVPDDLFDAMKQGAAQMPGAGSAPVITGAFSGGAGEEESGFPLVVIAVDRSARLGKMTPQALAKFEKGMRGAAKLSPGVNDMSAPVWESESKVIWVSASLMKGTEEEARLLWGVRLTNYGYIAIYCYTDPEQFDALEPGFRRIIRSVKPDPEVEYDPEAGGKRSTAESLGMLFAALAMLIGIIYWMRRGARTGRPAGLIR